MNAWLETRRLRVLIPLVWVATVAAAALGAGIYYAFAAGQAAQHHYYWREMVFGTTLITLASVTGIKGRRHEAD